MRLPDVTHSFIETNPDAPAEQPAWQHANARGLSFYAAERWHDAMAAFEEAIATAPRFAHGPGIHAVLRGNRAQALFRLGDTAGAIDDARRALAARVLCSDSDDDAPIARARADLSVYLAASGAHEEAATMLDLAREALEAQFGEEDERLLTVLENQARLALAAHQPARAEPVLLRLHALMEESGVDTSALNALFHRVAEARGGSVSSVSDATAPDNATPSSDIFAIVDDDFELIDHDTDVPMQSPNAQSILREGLIEPGQHATPPSMRRTNPLGFVVQYGVPLDVLEESHTPHSPPAELSDEHADHAHEHSSSHW